MNITPIFRRRVSPNRFEDPLDSLFQEMTQLIQDVDGSRLTRPVPETKNLGFVPSLNVSETPEYVRVSAELPGMDEKDIEVLVHENVLTLKGEKKSEHKEEKENFYRVERSYGAFERNLRLPAEIDAEKVSASFTKGVLSVTLAKLSPEKTQAKKISIKGE